MRKIFKYPLITDSVQKVFMRASEAQIISCKNQSGVITIWANVVPSETTEIEKEIHIIGTGGDVPEIESGKSYLKFLDSVFDGPYVWHVYEKCYFPPEEETSGKKKIKK